MTKNLAHPDEYIAELDRELAQWRRLAHVAYRLVRVADERHLGVTTTWRAAAEHFVAEFREQDR